MSYTKPGCEICKRVDEPLVRVKLTYMCAECTRALVAAWARAGVVP